MLNIRTNFLIGWESYAFDYLYWTTFYLIYPYPLYGLIWLFLLHYLHCLFIWLLNLHCYYYHHQSYHTLILTSRRKDFLLFSDFDEIKQLIDIDWLIFSGCQKNLNIFLWSHLTAFFEGISLLFCCSSLYPNVYPI